MSLEFPGQVSFRQLGSGYPDQLCHLRIFSQQGDVYCGNARQIGDKCLNALNYVGKLRRVHLDRVLWKEKLRNVVNAVLVVLVNHSLRSEAWNLLKKMVLMVGEICDGALSRRVQLFFSI